MKTDKRVRFSLFAVVDDVMRDRIADTLRIVNLNEHADQLGRSLVSWSEAVAGNWHAANAGSATAAAG